MTRFATLSLITFLIQFHAHAQRWNQSEQLLHLDSLDRAKLMQERDSVLNAMLHSLSNTDTVTFIYSIYIRPPQAYSSYSYNIDLTPIQEDGPVENDVKHFTSVSSDSLTSDLYTETIRVSFPAAQADSAYAYYQHVRQRTRLKILINQDKEYKVDGNIDVGPHPKPPFPATDGFNDTSKSTNPIKMRNSIISISKQCKRYAYTEAKYDKEEREHYDKQVDHMEYPRYEKWLESQDMIAYRQSVLNGLYYAISKHLCEE